MDSENTHTDSECFFLLQKILNGYSAFLKTYLTEGWKNSECINFFHPTASQQYEEHKTISKNLKRLSRNKEEDKEVFTKDFKQNLHNVDEENEPLTLLGLCLWDIFSDNHSVVDAIGEEYDLGSFRGSAAFIAELISGDGKENDEVINYGYMDFYQGTIWIRKRGNLLPFYEYIFTMLKSEGCDWKYSFPRMSLINLRQDESDAPEKYDPEKAMEQEIKNKQSEEFQKNLDNIYEEAYEEAKYKEPPKTVLAYRKIYGVLPDGHPQKNI